MNFVFLLNFNILLLLLLLLFFVEFISYGKIIWWLTCTQVITYFCTKI